MRSLAGALLAEAIGVFCLVFFGCGAIMVDAKSGGPGDVGIALPSALPSWPWSTPSAMCPAPISTPR